MSQKEQLGFWSAVSLVVGTVIGSGIFMLPAVIASYGGIGIVGWAMSGIGALFLALCFSRLSRRCPKIGGPYAYSRSAFGDLVGFQVAACFWVRGIVSISAIALVGVSYLSSLIPVLKAEPLYRSLVAMGIIYLLTYVNLRGVKPVGMFLIITSAVKVLPLLFMSIVGIFYIDFSHFTPFNISDLPSAEAIMAAAAVTFFSFMGIESATIPSDVVQDPGKTIPRATLFGTIGVVVLYLMSATAILGIVPLDMLSQSNAPFGLAAELIFGAEWGGIASKVIICCAIVSCLGAINGYLLLQAKMPFAAAHDGLFPKIFMRENDKNAPWFGLISCALGASILLLLTTTSSVADQFEKIVLIAAFLGLFIYAYSSISEVVMMTTDKNLYTPRDFWRAAFVAFFAFSYCIWAMAGAGATIGFLGILFMFATLPVYVWMCWNTVKSERMHLHGK